jgi:hypothetical protein
MSIATNDNFNINAPKVIDDRYSVGGVTPYASIASANAAIPLTRRALGLTVLIGAVEYWYQSGITDPDLVIKGGGASIILPKERTVYLYEDTTYATAAGVLNNVYTTFQNAYNAANALQLSLGGANIVYLKVVGLLPSSNLVLTANYNQYVRLIGDSRSTSSVGSITLSNAAGNGFNFSTVYASFLTIGAITTAALAGGFNGGTVNMVVDDVFVSSLDTTSINGISGTISVYTHTGAIFGQVRGHVKTSGVGTAGSITFYGSGSYTIAAINPSLQANNWIPTTGGALYVDNANIGQIEIFSFTGLVIRRCVVGGHLWINPGSPAGPLSLDPAEAWVIENSIINGEFMAIGDQNLYFPYLFANNTIFKSDAYMEGVAYATFKNCAFTLPSTFSGGGLYNMFVLGTYLTELHNCSLDAFDCQQFLTWDSNINFEDPFGYGGELRLFNCNLTGPYNAGTATGIDSSTPQIVTAKNVFIENPNTNITLV